jgi:hypothetical protein
MQTISVPKNDIQENDCRDDSSFDKVEGAIGQCHGSKEDLRIVGHD